MPYIEETCVSGRVIEVEKYYTYKWHSPDKEKREKKENSKTSEAQKKRNQRRAEKNLRRLMNANFEDGDYLVRLDFSQAPGGSVEMQPMIAKAIRDMRRTLKKQGKELKYIYVKEIGPRGGRHIHMLVNKMDPEIITRAWPHGGVHFDPLYGGGQYRRIAAYFIKYANTTEETEGKLIGKRWYGSRNLKKPVVRRRVIKAKKFRKTPKDIKGYVLDKDTEVSGVTQDGYEYYAYQLVRLGG